MELCRVCGRKCVARCQSKERFRSLIKRAFDQDINDDCLCYSKLQRSTKVCEDCRQDLQAYKRHYQHKKTPYKFRIQLLDIIHETGCQEGEEHMQSAEPISLQQVADGFAKSNNFAAWEQNSTLIYAKICKDSSSPVQVQIEPDGSWVILALGRPVTVANNIDLNSLPRFLTAENVNCLFDKLRKLKVCEGNPEFQDLCRDRFPDSPAVFNGAKNLAREEMTDGLGKSTIRHSNCHLLSQQDKCNECKNYKITLNALHHKLKKKPEIPAATTRHDCLTKEQLAGKLKEAKAETNTLKRELKSLNKVIAKETGQHGVSLDSAQSAEFTKIMNDHKKEVIESVDDSSPELLLWKQHIENGKRKSKKGHRWHPLILKWCIGLHHKSSSAYEYIRATGMMSLPGSSTLRRYFHFTNPTPGYNADVLEELVKQSGIDNLDDKNDFKRNVTIIFDEIKIKAGLIYKASTGKLIGYMDMGTVNNELSEFSRRVSNGGTAGAPEVATHILSVMVRGIFSPLHTSFGYFPTCTATGDQLYSVIWDGVSVLETLGFYVRAFIADGASTNRKFFKLHSKDRVRTTHCTSNIYSSDGRDVYFICDPPHLIKTVRNNWENSGWNNKTRKLTFNKQEIKWPQLVRLYDGEDLSKNSPGYNTVYKLSKDHIHLNPSLRMKVKLAAQVLSSTVANAFVMEGRTDTQSTVKFVRNMDKFFDCLNVQNLYKGTHQRNKNRVPYTSTEDERLQWLKKDFLGWLDEWESEAMATPLPRNEQRKLCLSEQTLDGLRITVYSFVSLAEELLVLPGVKYLLSDKFNQDPQEEAFSKIRSSGGNMTNPTVDQYGDASLKILVGGACIRGSMKANVKRQPLLPVNSILPKTKKLKDVVHA